MGGGHGATVGKGAQAQSAGLVLFTGGGGVRGIFSSVPDPKPRGSGGGWGVGVGGPTRERPRGHAAPGDSRRAKVDGVRGGAVDQPPAICSGWTTAHVGATACYTPVSSLGQNRALMTLPGAGVTPYGVRPF